MKEDTLRSLNEMGVHISKLAINAPLPHTNSAESAKETAP